MKIKVENGGARSKIPRECTGNQFSEENDDIKMGRFEEVLCLFKSFHGLLCASFPMT